MLSVIASLAARQGVAIHFRTRIRFADLWIATPINRLAMTSGRRASFLPPRILGIAVLLVVLFVDFRVELD